MPKFSGSFFLWLLLSGSQIAIHKSWQSFLFKIINFIFNKKVVIWWLFTDDFRVRERKPEKSQWLLIWVNVKTHYEQNCLTRQIHQIFTALWQGWGIINWTPPTLLIYTVKLQLKLGHPQKVYTLQLFAIHIRM